MFRLNRHKSDRSGERIEFKLSNFQAFQVPKGWDKLFLSVISVETGKTIAKSSKAAVHGGTCQWTESFSESIWVSQDDASKELAECLYKIIVVTGSARSGILGEIILNLTDHRSSGDCGPLSLPLKKCNHGTILQIKVQCHTPKTKIRDKKSWKENTSHPEDLHNNSDDMDSKSDGSDNMFNKSVGSASSSPLGMPSYPDEHGNREKSFSASGSHRSSDSGESYTGKAIFSPVNSLNGGAYVGRQGSAGSHASATHVAGLGDDVSRSNHSSFNSRASGSSFNTNQWHDLAAQTSTNGFAPLLSRPSDSSKDLLEAAEETIEELSDEAKMWERHARKLKLDLEILKKESLDKSKHQANLEMDLSSACDERDSLRQEVEQIKLLASRIDEMIHVQKELEDEVKFEKEINSNLTLQLKKTQEANIELVSILQELEETVEKQNLEITNLSRNHHGNEHEESPRSQKAEEMIKLEGKISGILNAQHGSEVVYDGGHPDLIKEIENLKAKVQELEGDCAELTDENLELILKLKESRKDSGEGMASHNSIFNDLKNNFSPNNSEFEIGQLKLRINQLEEELENKEIFSEGLTAPLKIKIKSLEKKCTDLELELQHFKDQAYNLGIEHQKSRAEVKEKIQEFAELKFGTSQDLVSNIQREKDQLEEELAISSKCLDDVRHDLMIHTSNLDSQVSINKMLERKSMELENGKHELELHLSELEQENVQLSERISGLEAQLRYLTNEKESYRLELEDSRSLIMDLKDEITKQQDKLETQKAELKQKSQEAQKRLSEAQEESEYLKRSHSKLQTTVESLIEECSSLQKSTTDLRRQKSELHEHSSHLEVNLNESQKRIIDLCKKVEFLEVRFSSLQKDIASKENSLVSQLDNIFQEHKDHDEKISQAHIMLNQVESAKTVEVENLERQITHLTSQLSSTHDERERIASDAVCEVFDLRSNKTKLENNLQEVHAKVKLYESELHTLQQESENKVQGLVDLLNASKQSEEMLMADIERMQRIMESVKSSEEKFRRTANELELKLKATDYEKQQIEEEISSLKVQSQKIAHLQDEILVVKSSLDEEKFEKGKLEELLHSASEEREELMTERVSFMDKISNMQRALHESEDDKRSRIALEEKLLRMEGDLTAREASYAHEAELKNELNRIKRANSDYHRKIQSLEEEKDEVLRKAQVLEKELKLKKAESVDENVSSEDRKERPHISDVDLESRIHFLENELSQALETNDMYKMQLEKSLSEKQNDDADAVKETVSENNTSINYRAEISSLEAELREMRERYLHMSLQFAEVEAQREQLVMQLKSTKKEKKWFS